MNKFYSMVFIVVGMLSTFHVEAEQSSEYRRLPIFVRSDETVSRPPFDLWAPSVEYGVEVSTLSNRKENPKEILVSEVWSALKNQDSQKIESISINYDAELTTQLFSMLGNKISPEDRLLTRVDFGDLSIFMVELQKEKKYIPITIVSKENGLKFDMLAAMDPIVQVISGTFLYQSLIKADKKDKIENPCKFFVDLPFNGVLPEKNQIFLCFEGDVVHNEKANDNSRMAEIISRIEHIHGRSSAMSGSELKSVFGEAIFKMFMTNYSNEPTEEFFSRFFNNYNPEFLSRNDEMCYFFYRQNLPFDKVQVQYRILQMLEGEWKIVGLDHSGPFDLLLGDPLVLSRIQHIIENDLRELPVD